MDSSPGVTFDSASVSPSNSDIRISRKPHSFYKKNLKNKTLSFRDLDSDGDGVIDANDLASFLRMYNAFQRDYKFLFKMVMFLCFGIVFAWVVVLATVIPLGLIATEVRHNDNNVVVDGSGIPLSIGQSVTPSQFSCTPEAVAALQWLMLSPLQKVAVTSVIVDPNATVATITTGSGIFKIPCASSLKRQDCATTGTCAPPSTLGVLPDLTCQPPVDVIPDWLNCPAWHCNRTGFPFCASQAFCEAGVNTEAGLGFGQGCVACDPLSGCIQAKSGAYHLALAFDPPTGSGLLPISKSYACVPFLHGCDEFDYSRCSNSEPAYLACNRPSRGYIMRGDAPINANRAAPRP